MKHNLFNFFIVVGSILPSLSSANCMHEEVVDLRQTASAEFSNLQVQDQGNYGICYAYAASTMIDFYRILKKSDRYQFVSTDPMAAAIQSTSAMAEMSVEGGQICDVVNGLSKMGFGCGLSGVSVKSIKGFGDAVHDSLLKTVFMPYVLKDKTFVAVDLKHKDRLSKDQKVYLKNMADFLKQFEVELKMRDIPRDHLPKKEALFEFFQNVYVNNSWASLEGPDGHPNCSTYGHFKLLRVIFTMTPSVAHFAV